MGIGNARVRLLSLWLSQTARVMADWCLRVFVILEWARQGEAEGNSAWHLVTALFISPFVILAPFHGAISNGLPRRWVLTGSAAYCFLVVVFFGLIPGPWLICLVLMAIGSALYSPTRYAMLPAAAKDTHIPLGRVMGWIEMGGAGGIVSGLVIGWYFSGRTWTEVAPWTGLLASWPADVAAATILNGICLFAALPARFPSDPRRPEPAIQAVQGFFRDTRRILNNRDAWASLAGLAGLLALVASGAGALFALTRDAHFMENKAELLHAMIAVAIGAALGAWVAGRQTHPYRGLGLVPVATVGLLGSLVWAGLASDLVGPGLLLGVMGGLANVPLRTFYQVMVPADARGNAMAVMNFAIYLATVLFSSVLFGLTQSRLLPTPNAQFWVLALAATLGSGLAWRTLFRNSLEQLAELILWPFYRIRGVGPGLESIPLQGPVLLVANHSAWFDPLWLGKVIPRFLTPMMTSVFYDRPVLRWLMTSVVGTIRVPTATFRREAPEIQDAIKALDQGKIVMIFPEGMLRRSDEKLIRNFGQGVWRILRDRPATPVVTCWIEGGWGSFVSYRGGPPTLNKRLDWFRLIRVAVPDPKVLKKEILAEHRLTRRFLMQACLDSRDLLGLPPGKIEEPETEGDGESKSDHLPDKG